MSKYVTLVNKEGNATTDVLATEVGLYAEKGWKVKADGKEKKAADGKEKKADK